MSTIGDAQTAPIPIIPPSRRLRDSFRSLAHRNYRRFQFAHFALHAGTWMFRIAVDWLALEISGNVAAVGMLVFVQWAPMILLAPYGAMIADRFSRRVTVAVVYGAFSILAGILFVLVLTEAVQIWHIVLIAFLVGLIYTVEIPARVVLLSEMVPPVDLQNAISVYAIVFWFGGMVGPVLSGLIISTVGTEWAILFYAVACVIVAATVSLLRVSELRVIPPSALGRPRFRETLRYARAKPTILWPLVLIGCFAVFVLPMGVALTGIARSVFGSGPSGLGLYSSMLAVGALVGALVSTRVRALRLRTVMVAAGVFASLQLISGLMQIELAFVLLMVAVGCFRLIYEVVSDSLVQLSSNPQIRGRIVSLYTTAVAGGVSVGGLLMGGLSDLWGAQMAIVVTATVPLLAAVVIAIVLAPRTSLTRVFRLGRGRSMLGSVIREPE